MSGIRITHVTPLYGHIILIILENRLLNKRMAKLLIDEHGDIWSPRGGANFISQDFDALWEDDIEPGESGVEISIEVDEMLLCDIKTWCFEGGVSVEQLTVAFLRFCANEENHDEVHEWLTDLLSLKDTVSLKNLF